jgi:hypothetical protein
MRYKKWVACADYHGDKHDRRAAALFREFVRFYRPSRRWFLGDLFDFRPWRVGADEEERRERIAEDFEAGIDFMAWYRPHVITLGNHDIRLWDTRDRGGPMADFADSLIKRFEKLAECLGVRVLPYDKRKGVHREGRLKMAHGFFDGTTAARQMAQSYGSILFGHGHAIDVATTPGPEPRAGRMIGCLCRLDFRYNRSHVATLRQRHGWAYGTLFKNGMYQAFQAEVIGQHAVVAERIKILKAMIGN